MSAGRKDGGEEGEKEGKKEKKKEKVSVNTEGRGHFSCMATCSSYCSATHNVKLPFSGVIAHSDDSVGGCVCVRASVRVVCCCCCFIAEAPLAEP